MDAHRSNSAPKARQTEGQVKGRIDPSRTTVMHSCAWYCNHPAGERLLRLTSWQSDREIAGCISDIGVPFSPEDLLKPQPQQIQKVFEWFAELLMNTTRETVEPAMRAAAEDVCTPQYMEIIPSDTRNLMGFYSSLRKLLVEVGSATTSMFTWRIRQN